MGFISKPMGWILSQISTLFSDNFAVSVLVFTILVNVIMLPLTLKSQKSTAKQAKVKHKLDALKKKYGDDRQKYSQAMQEVYNKEGISMGGGCLPMIIRLVIMMGVYYAIFSPFTYVVGNSDKAINTAYNWVSYVRVAEDYGDNDISADDWKALGLEAKTQELSEEAKKLGYQNAEHYAKVVIVSEVNKLDKSAVADGSAQKRVRDKTDACKVTRELEIANYITADAKEFEPVVLTKFQEQGGKVGDINYNLFGIDLRDTPDFGWNIAEKWEANWIIPLASFAASLLTGIISQIIQKKTNPGAPNMMAMMLIMPLFSLYIAFGFPCAVGFYWACSSLVSGGLQVLTQVFYGPNVVNARDQVKSILTRAKYEQSIIASAESKEAE